MNDSHQTCSDMKDDKKQKRRGKPEADPREIGVVRVFSNPGPDAEERLRRLMTLMIKYATGNGVAPTSADLDLNPGEGETGPTEKKSSSSQDVPEADD